MSIHRKFKSTSPRRNIGTLKTLFAVFPALSAILVFLILRGEFSTALQLTWSAASWRFA
jgi:hypothetical protein